MMQLCQVSSQTIQFYEFLLIGSRNQILSNAAFCSEISSQDPNPDPTIPTDHPPNGGWCFELESVTKR